MVVCFYHSADLDGHCSGAIVKMYNRDAIMYPVNYGKQRLSEFNVPDGCDVFVVDFCFEPEEMLELATRCKLHWYDHHKTHIEANIDSLRDIADCNCMIGKAGCELTWDSVVGTSTASIVHYLGRYDVWDLQPGCLEIQLAMRMDETDPRDEQSFDRWLRLFSLDNGNFLTNKLIEDGRLLKRYKDQDNTVYCRSTCFETELDGLRCIATNKMLTNSQVFDSVWDKEKYDAMLTFGWRKGQWVVSLYSDKPEIDVSATCKKFGGGGHKGAAGFQCDSLPFKLN